MLFAVLGGVLGQPQMVEINFVALFFVIAVSSAVAVIPVNALVRWALVPGGNRRSLVAAQPTESRLW
jgi:hypothetical protein